MPPTPEISAEAVEKYAKQFRDKYVLGFIPLETHRQIARDHLHQLADKTREIERLKGMYEFTNKEVHEEEVRALQLQQERDDARAEVNRLTAIAKQATYNALNADEHYTILVTKYNAAWKERDQLTTQLQSAQAAMEVKDEAIRAAIHIHDHRREVWPDCPLNFGSKLFEALSLTSGSELIKQNENK